MPSQRVTIADVADEVGVSMMTVSRVINNKGDVSEQTEQRVWAAIERLDYRPSNIARGLATQRTQTVGLVVPDVGNPFFSDIASGVERRAYASDYSVFLCNTNEDPLRERAVLNSLVDQQVDGVVLCSSRLSEADILSLAARVSALVLINRHLEGVQGFTVCVDDEPASRRLTRHLINSGHRHIGLLAGPSTSDSGRLRVDGYCQALEEARIVPRQAWIRHCVPQVGGALEAATRLLQEYPQLTALVCYNDLVAVGALQACARLGLQVPNDLAVVGFDDIHLAELVTPSLTTCRVPREQLGHDAMALLLAQMDGEEIAERSIVIEPELIVRESAP